MTRIAIDLPSSYAAATALRSASGRVDDIRAALNHQWSRLDGRWEGRNKHRVENRVNDALSDLGRLNDSLYRLGVRLETIARNFENADEAAGQSLAIMSWCVYVPLPGEAWPDGLRLPPGMMAAWPTFQDAGLSAIEMLGPVGAFAAGVWGDFRGSEYGGNWMEVVGVNAIDAVLSEGLETLLEKAGLGPIMLINGAIQVAGNLDVAMLQVQSDYFGVDDEARSILLGDAAQVKQAVDQVDLGNVTKAFSHGVFNTLMPPQVSQAYGEAIGSLWNDPSLANAIHVTQTLDSVLAQHRTELLDIQRSTAILGPMGPMILTPSGREGLFNTATAAVNVVDGVVDYSWTRAAAFLNQNIALTTNSITRLPLPGDLEAGLISASNDFMQFNQNVAGGFINFINL